MSTTEVCARFHPPPRDECPGIHPAAPRRLQLAEPEGTRGARDDKTIARGLDHIARRSGSALRERLRAPDLHRLAAERRRGARRPIEGADPPVDRDRALTPVDRRLVLADL